MGRHFQDQVTKDAVTYFCLARLLVGSWVARSGGSQLPRCEDTQAAKGEASVVRGWVLLPTAR